MVVDVVEGATLVDVVDAPACVVVTPASETSSDRSPTAAAPLPNLCIPSTTPPATNDDSTNIATATGATLITTHTANEPRRRTSLMAQTCRQTRTGPGASAPSPATTSCLVGGDSTGSGPAESATSQIRTRRRRRRPRPRARACGQPSWRRAWLPWRRAWPPPPRPRPRPRRHRCWDGGCG